MLDCPLSSPRPAQTRTKALHSCWRNTSAARSEWPVRCSGGESHSHNAAAAAAAASKEEEEKGEEEAAASERFQRRGKTEKVFKNFSRKKLHKKTYM